MTGRNSTDPYCPKEDGASETCKTKKTHLSGALEIRNRLEVWFTEEVSSETRRGLN